ncbi:MAG: ring-opening amidohydrolase [Thermaerobacter sp.]|nr:ring-opening amidohydrolase [Thermaerobacter sp.]
MRGALAEGRFAAGDIIAIIGKTEGNGGRNDFSRELAVRALADELAEPLGLSRDAVLDRVIFSFSGGTEGVVSPHYLVVWRTGIRPSRPVGPKRLAVAAGRTRPFMVPEVGRRPMIEETARVVRQLMAAARVAPADVHMVQIKGAILPGGEHDGRNNMVYSRAASALGVGVALGEFDTGDLSDETVARDFSLFSRVASTSAKPGLLRSEIILFGNSPYWEGDLLAAHEVMDDMVDLAAVGRLLSSLGLGDRLPLPQAASDRLAAVFAKAEADPRMLLRGRRHTMLTDDDVQDMRYARCVVGAVLAAATGDPACYVSTRAEHHGPLGGGPVVAIARVGEATR